VSLYRDKRSPYWQYDFRFKGVRHYGSTGCTSKRAAEQYEARERQKAALPSQERPPISLDEAAGLYQEHAETLPSWPTIRYMTGALVKGIGANRTLAQISQRELQVYFAKRRDGRTNASVNREIENARAIWLRAKKARFDVGEMPEWRALFLKVPKAPPRIASDGEEAALFEALAGDAFDVVRFALLSGWRKAEVIGLRWADLDLQNGRATTKIKGGDTVVRPLSPSLVALIANQPKVGPFVFTYVCRKSRAKRRKDQRYPMTVTALRTRWQEAKDAAEIAGLRFHDLRHTAATRLLSATGNLATVAAALQHRNIKTTQRYAHTSEADVRAGLVAVESRIIPGQPNSDRRKG
jgi:integrase